MIYLIIINGIICLVLIGTYFMHSNNYASIDGRINRIDTGIGENWNYFSLLKSIKDEIINAQENIRNINNDTSLKHVNKNLEEIKGEVFALTGAYDEKNIKDVYEQLERIEGVISNLDSSTGLGRDIIDGLDKIDDEVSSNIIKALSKIQGAIEYQTAMDKMNKGI